MVAAVGVTGYYLIAHAVALARISSKVERRVVTGRYFSLWAGALLSLLGIPIQVRGRPPEGGALVTPNHQSYLDVLALGSQIPIVFVSKVEVASWPFIGFLLRRTEQLYVSRRRSRDLVDSLDEVTQRLREGGIVGVFLEGTTSAGDRVREFRSPLLQPAIDSGCSVVPVAIRWRVERPDLDVSEDVAYWKDHHFVTHAWRVLGLRGIAGEVRFGSPIQAGRSADRRILARELRSRVVQLAGLG